MDQEYTGDARLAPAFLSDLDTLSPNALRKAYPKESRSYARLKRAQADGFEVDAPWDAPGGFRDFLRDIGPAPSPDATVDRIDNDLRRYGPGLCRWADPTTQTRNRRITKRLTWQGRSLTYQEFAEEIGIAYSTVHGALARGETPGQIARRHRTPSNGVLGGYVPAWANTDHKRARFREEFEKWRTRLRRSARATVRPELYDAIWLSREFDRVKGPHPVIDELHPDEYEAASRGHLGPIMRLRDWGPDWIRHALRALAQHDRPLAVKLLASPLSDLHLYESRLLPPPPDPARRKFDDY